MTRICRCAARRYGEGFYELRARTQVGTPFHAAFWLQGTKSEIDVVEFVDKNMADGGNAKYFVNLHWYARLHWCPRAQLERIIRLASVSCML